MKIAYTHRHIILFFACLIFMVGLDREIYYFNSEIFPIYGSGYCSTNILQPHTKVMKEDMWPDIHCLAVFAHVKTTPDFIGYHCPKPFSYTNFCKSADFSCLKDAGHQPHSVETMTKKHLALCLQELVMHLSVVAKHQST